MASNKQVLRTTEGLPPGWEKGFDPSTGKIFFIDHNTKTTMWDLPQHVKDYVIQHSQIINQVPQQPLPPPPAAPPSSESQHPMPSLEPRIPAKEEGVEESFFGGIVPDIAALPPPNQVSVVVPSPIEFMPPPPQESPIPASSSSLPGPVPEEEGEREGEGERPMQVSPQPSQMDPFFGELPLPQQSSQLVTNKEHSTIHITHFNLFFSTNNLTEHTCYKTKNLTSCQAWNQS